MGLRCTPCGALFFKVKKQWGLTLNPDTPSSRLPMSAYDKSSRLEARTSRPGIGLERVCPMRAVSGLWRTKPSRRMSAFSPHRDLTLPATSRRLRPSAIGAPYSIQRAQRALHATTADLQDARIDHLVATSTCPSRSCPVRMLFSTEAGASQRNAAACAAWPA